jgi:hypothetical protein
MDPFQTRTNRLCQRLQSAGYESETDRRLRQEDPDRYEQQIRQLEEMEPVVSDPEAVIQEMGALASSDSEGVDSEEAVHDRVILGVTRRGFTFNDDGTFREEGSRSRLTPSPYTLKWTVQYSPQTATKRATDRQTKSRTEVLRDCVLVKRLCRVTRSWTRVADLVGIQWKS